MSRFQTKPGIFTGEAAAKDIHKAIQSNELPYVVQFDHLVNSCESIMQLHCRLFITQLCIAQLCITQLFTPQ